MEILARAQLPLDRIGLLAQKPRVVAHVGASLGEVFAPVRPPVRAPVDNGGFTTDGICDESRCFAIDDDCVHASDSRRFGRNFKRRSREKRKSPI